MTLTHTERLQACISNDPALDRVPVALWRHFPVDDQTPETLAAATLHFQNNYDFDLVKVTPASSFCLKDWGADDLWEGHPEGTRRYTKRVISEPMDWEKLPLLTPSAPHLAGQLACLRLIRAGLGSETPMLQTIFSPLAQAKNLAGGDILLAHLRRYPEAVLKGLETITESTRRFIRAAVETGIDGIFYAVQHAQGHLLAPDEFSLFAQPYDIRLLDSAGDLWCNMVHLHGENIHFEKVSRYPAHILNWHDRETDWPLAEGQKFFRGAVCGGLSQDTLVLGTQAQVQDEAVEALTQTSGKRFILGTGCVVPVIAPHGNILTARKAVTV